jgi:hypothetical protein
MEWDCRSRAINRTAPEESPGLRAQVLTLSMPRRLLLLNSNIEHHYNREVTVRNSPKELTKKAALTKKHLTKTVVPVRREADPLLGTQKR